MAIDAYSHCPGGTGKKIKFCCGDFLPELQKIDRMIEGEQFLAALQHIDQLMAKEPGRDRECLLAMKCLLLRVTEQYEAAKATAASFLVKYPNNQVALAEMATQATIENPTAALELLERAIRAGEGSMEPRTYQAMGLVAGSLLHAGIPLPARALLQLQCDIAQQDERPAALLTELCQAADIPLLLRDEPPLAPCPADAPWKDRFDDILQLTALGDWLSGAERLAALAGEASDSTAVWRDLAVLRGWTADNAGACEAWRRYAALRAAEQDGLEDAVEAEATAMFLSDDPLGDKFDVLKLEWTVNDADRAQEAFLSSPCWRAIPFDPAQFSDGNTPPPKGVFVLLDRPAPDSAAELTAASMPCFYGQAMLFGRQTDREARLEVAGVMAGDRAAVVEMVRAAAGDAVAAEPEQQVMGRASATQQLLHPSWLPPRDVTPEQIRAILADFSRDAILNRWPDMKLGVLDGLSPREAAADPSRHVRLLAAILVLGHWAESLDGAPDMNELRSSLGLPTLEPIDLGGLPAELVAELPITRLGRLNVEGLSDTALLDAFFRAAAFALRGAIKKFGLAVIERPSLADSAERLHVLSTLARSEEDPAKALAYIEQGRRGTEAKKVSHAAWDLMELSVHFAHRNGPEAMRMIEHIQNRHIEERGVGEALTRMLIGVGLLRPDGTPAFGPGAAGAAPMAESPAAEPEGLWTPDGAQPSGGGKLWTPE